MSTFDRYTIFWLNRNLKLIYPIIHLYWLFIYFLVFGKTSKSCEVLPFHSWISFSPIPIKINWGEQQHMSCKKFPSSGIFCCHVTFLSSSCLSPNLSVVLTECLLAHTFVQLQNKASVSSDRYEVRGQQHRLSCV